jgi:hypothetical protein
MVKGMYAMVRAKAQGGDAERKSKSTTRVLLKIEAMI